MMEPVQILAIAFALFALSRVILRVKDKQLTINEFIFWCFVWTALIVLAIFPWITVHLSGFLGFGRGLDLVIYLSIGVLFYLMFRTHVRIDEQEHRITRLVRALAIKKKK